MKMMLPCPEAGVCGLVACTTVRMGTTFMMSGPTHAASARLVTNMAVPPENTARAFHGYDQSAAPHLSLPNNDKQLLLVLLFSSSN